MILTLILQMLPNPKIGNVSGKGRQSRKQCMRSLMIHFLSMILNPPIVIHLLFELRWQARVREEKMDEGAIVCFQEEEERVIIKNFSDSVNTNREDTIPDTIQVSRSSSSAAGQTHDDPIPVMIQVINSSSSAAVPTSSTNKPRLWMNNPSRPYISEQKSPEIIDLTESKDSDDDFFYDV